jgi:hypothetical protein
LSVNQLQRMLQAVMARWSLTLYPTGKPAMLKSTKFAGTRFTLKGYNDAGKNSDANLVWLEHSTLQKVMRTRRP